MYFLIIAVFLVTAVALSALFDRRKSPGKKRNRSFLFLEEDDPFLQSLPDVPEFQPALIPPSLPRELPPFMRQGDTLPFPNSGVSEVQDRPRVTSPRKPSSALVGPYGLPPGQVPHITGPLPSVASQHSQKSLYDLMQEYERGMHTGYDESLQAIHFVTTHVVMNTPTEVTLAFRVCIRQIQGVLRPRGLERAALLTDIGGLAIGREVTTEWGQALKKCFDQICLKSGPETYLVAHYDSRALRPD